MLIIVVIIRRSPLSKAAQIPGNGHGLLPFPSTRLEALWSMSPKLRAGSCAKQAQKIGGSTLWNFEHHPKLLERTQQKQNPGGMYWVYWFLAQHRMCVQMYTSCEHVSRSFLFLPPCWWQLPVRQSHGLAWSFTWGNSHGISWDELDTAFARGTQRDGGFFSKVDRPPNIQDPLETMVNGLIGDLLTHIFGPFRGCFIWGGCLPSFCPSWLAVSDT